MTARVYVNLPDGNLWKVEIQQQNLEV